MKQLFKFFNDNPPSFTKSDSTRMKCLGKTVDYSTEDGIKRLFTPEIVLKYKLLEFHELTYPIKIEVLTDFIEKTFRPEILDKRIQSAKLNEALSKMDVKLPDCDWFLHNIQPARQLGEQRKESGFCFIDKSTSKITEYDYYSVFYAMTRDLEEKDVKKFIQNFVQIKPEYNPHSRHVFEEIKGSNNVYRVNTYNPPYWKALKCNPSLPKEINELMVHLFPEEESRDFVYNWMYHSLHTRAQTFLYLCGGQGSGKNTLAKLLTELHGEHNTTLPKQGSIKGRFNSFLKNKRFVFFDEYSCRTSRDKDLLKSIINDRVQIEGKGIEHEDIAVHASFLIANNSKEALGLDPIDRRFSVPNISHANLLESHNANWIHKFYSLLERPEYIGQFGEWLYSTYSKGKYTEVEPYQKHHFESIVIATARQGIAYTLDKVLQSEDTEYQYDNEKSSFERLTKNKYPHISDWQNFFKEVKYKGEKLGSLDTKLFTPRAEFVKGES